MILFTDSQAGYKNVLRSTELQKLEKNGYPVSKASARGSLHPALPVEGATQAPIIEAKVVLEN